MSRARVLRRHRRARLVKERADLKRSKLGRSHPGEATSAGDGARIRGRHSAISIPSTPRQTCIDSVNCGRPPRQEPTTVSCSPAKWLLVGRHLLRTRIDDPRSARSAPRWPLLHIGVRLDQDPPEPAAPGAVRVRRLPFRTTARCRRLGAGPGTVSRTAGHESTARERRVPGAHR
jgi:hypothetical protein